MKHKRKRTNPISIFLALIILAAGVVFVVALRRGAAPSLVISEETAPAETADPVITPSPSPSPEPTPTPVPLNTESVIETVEYTTRDYYSGNPGDIIKQMSVYLPPEYDPDTQYDAVFLMHVLGCDETFWPELGIKELADSLIASGSMRPVIIFMPDGYANDDVRGVTGLDDYYVQFGQEFRNDIIPCVREHYMLYETKEHYAFIGASFGAYMTNLSVMADDIDLVGYFGYIGGGTIHPESLQSQWANKGLTDTDILMLYIGEGEFDDIGTVYASYQQLMYYTSMFSESNVVFSEIPGVGHEAAEWLTGAAEAMALFFPVENQGGA